MRGSHPHSRGAPTSRFIVCQPTKNKEEEEARHMTINVILIHAEASLACLHSVER